MCTVGEGTYLISASRSNSSPRSSVFSSSPDERSTTLRLRFGGVRAGPFSLALRAANRGSCRCLVRRSRSSSSVAVSSAPRSELSSPLCRCGDLGRLSLEPDRGFILRRGARQGTNASPRTCTHNPRNLVTNWEWRSASRWSHNCKPLQIERIDDQLQCTAADSRLKGKTKHIQASTRCGKLRVGSSTIHVTQAIRSSCTAPRALYCAVASGSGWRQSQVLAMSVRRCNWWRRHS